MMDWLITSVYFLLLLFIIRRIDFFVPEHISFRLAAIAFFLKTIAGILLGCVYAVYYKINGDSFEFFRDGNILYQSLYSHPADYLRMMTGISSENSYLKEHYYNFMSCWTNHDFDFSPNDTRSIVRLNAFIRIFSFGIYNVHAVFFSFLSFAGLTALYRFFSGAIKSNHKIFYCAMMLFPSVAFWGSGVMKETVVLFALGCTLYFSWKCVYFFSLKDILILLLFLFLLGINKFYYVIILIPSVVAFWLSKNRKYVFLKFAFLHIAWMLILFSVRLDYPMNNIPEVLERKQINFLEYATAAKSGSIIQSEKLRPSWGYIFKKSPKAFLIALLTPLTFSANNIMQTVASFESILILLMILAAAIFFRTPGREAIPHLLLCASFVIITFTLLGLITPVAGALVRYKIVALPFLVFLILYCMDFNKLTRLFKS